MSNYRVTKVTLHGPLSKTLTLLKWDWPRNQPILYITLDENYKLYVIKCHSKTKRVDVRILIIIYKLQHSYFTYTNLFHMCSLQITKYVKSDTERHSSSSGCMFL